MGDLLVSVRKTPNDLKADLATKAAFKLAHFVASFLTLFFANTGASISINISLNPPFFASYVSQELEIISLWLISNMSLLDICNHN